MSLDDLINQLLDEKAPPASAPAMPIAGAQPSAGGNGATLNAADAEALAIAQSEANKLRAEVLRLASELKVLKAENEALMANARAAPQQAAAAPQPSVETISVPSDAQFPWKRHIANVEDNLRRKETSVAECALKVLVDVAEAISIEPAARARLLTQLGTVRVDQGQFEEAEQTLNKAIQLLESNGLGSTMAAAYSLDALAQCQQAREDFGEAEKLRRKAVVIAEDTLGAEHPDVGFFRERLEILRQERALFDIGSNSETLLDRLHAEHQASLAAGNPPTPAEAAPAADGYMLMMFEKYIANAKTALAQKNAREAESYLKSAMEKAEGVPNSDPRKCESMRLLGQTLETQNKDQEAKALYEQALTLAFKHISWTDVQVAHCLQLLAGLHNKLDDFGMAKNYYKQALTNFTAILGKDHASTQALEEEYQAFIERLKSERNWKGWSN